MTTAAIAFTVMNLLILALNYRERRRIERYLSRRVVAVMRPDDRIERKGGRS